MSGYTEETVLRIDGIPLPAGSSRGIKQSISPIDNGPLVRMMSGALRDLTRPALRKYQSTITFTDVWAPCLAALQRGQEIVLDCVVEFVEPVGIDQVRPHVDDSLYFVDAESRVVDPTDPEAEPAVFRVYRPRLTVLVLRWESERDEYAETVTSTLEVGEA